ncbi:MAG: RNA 2'-phosphotransferase [Bacteroidota bacterium]
MKLEKHISKFMSLVLRHQPDVIGLELDDQGWANLDELIDKMNQKGKAVDRGLIEHIVATNNKKRFIISDDGTRIRANQGHSINIDLALQAIEPPVILYHGTATRFLDRIFEYGLQKRNRQHVHLSDDLTTAMNVGQRHGKPVILEVQALEMHQKGYPFFRSENGVWLTDHVPENYLATQPIQ